MRVMLWTVGCLLLTLTGGATAQTDARPEFEVASIKPAAPDARGMFIRPTPGGRVNITNMTLKELIVIAWRIQPFQISGGPAWLDSVHYDIAAKSEDSSKPSEMPLMLQSLLKDRFQLTLHRETKELPIYALVMAKKDGKLGPRLTESKEGGCTPLDPSKGPPPPEPGKPPTLGCGGLFMQPRLLRGTGVTIDRLIPMLSPSRADRGRQDRIDREIRHHHGMDSGRISIDAIAARSAEASVSRPRGSFYLLSPPGATRSQTRIAERSRGDLRDRSRRKTL